MRDESLKQYNQLRKTMKQKSKKSKKSSKVSESDDDTDSNNESSNDLSETELKLILGMNITLVFIAILMFVLLFFRAQATQTLKRS